MPATGRDHVPPRALLEKPYPANRKIVYACDAHNNWYSDDERYVRDALHQASFSELSLAKLREGGIVARSLDHSPLLKARIQGSFNPDGNFRPEISRFLRVFNKIARGLWYLKFQRFPREEGFQSIAVEHFKRLPAWLLQVVEHSPSSLRSWAEVGTSALERQARFWPGTPVPTPKPWIVVQPEVFEYMFTRLPNSKQMVCVMRLYRTIWGVVACPRVLNPAAAR